MRFLIAFISVLLISSPYGVGEDSELLTKSVDKAALSEAIQKGEYDTLFQGISTRNPEALEHYKLGLVLFTLHRGESVIGTQEGLDMAVEELKEAIRLDPQFARAYLTLGQALWEKSFLYAKSSSEQNRLQEAAYEAIQKAVDLEPVNPEINYFWGILLETFKKNYPQAAEAYRKALSAPAPSLLKSAIPEADIRYALGITLYKLGKVLEGIQEIRLAIKQMDPEGALLAKRFLATILEDQGRYQEALELYEQIKDPQDREKIELLREKAKTR